MNTMSVEEYIDNRFENQYRWYSRKSGRSRAMYMSLQAAAIIASVSIPFLAGVLSDPTVKPVVGGLGALVAILSGMSGLFQFQPNWVKFRATAEGLKREKYLFLTGSFPYSADDPFLLFVARVEDIIGKENVDWSNRLTALPELKKGQ